MKFKFSLNNFFISVVVIFLVVGFFIFLTFFSTGEEKKVDLKPEVSSKAKNLDINKTQYIKIAGKILKVDLALTSQEQEQGLSGRNKLNEDEGMLFVFNHMDKYSFWMKDMNFALDIIWLAPSESGDDEDFRVVYIKKNATPESYPETFTPSQNAKYVLEVLSQFSEKNNLKEGDKVEFISP